MSGILPQYVTWVESEFHKKCCRSLRILASRLRQHFARVFHISRWPTKKTIRWSYLLHVRAVKLPGMDPALSVKWQQKIFSLLWQPFYAVHAGCAQGISPISLSAFTIWCIYVSCLIIGTNKRQRTNLGNNVLQKAKEISYHCSVRCIRMPTTREAGQQHNHAAKTSEVVVL